MNIHFEYDSPPIIHPEKFISPKDEIYKMKPGDIVKGSAMQKEFKYYEFEVDSDQFDYIIKSWPSDENSDTDIYINNSSEKVTTNNFKWKDSIIGPVKVQINPSDPYFKIGTYSLGVLPYRENLNNYYLSFEKVSIKPLLNLPSNYSGQINPGEYKYFVFKSKSEKNTMIFVKATPGPSKIALFASTSIIYPNKKECQFKTFNMSDYSSEDLNVNSDLNRDFEPFTLDKDNNLIYLENPLNKTNTISSQNSVAMKIETYHSSLIDGRVFISVLNISSEATDFSILAKG